MKRSISHSELTKALTCQAQHAFAYTGHMTGGRALRPRTTGAKLREGKAWGRAVAAFHAQNHGWTAQDKFAVAEQWLVHELDNDADHMRREGLFVEDEYEQTKERLRDTLRHYCLTTTPLSIEALEMELRVPIRSRAGRRASTRFEFHGYVDGLARRGEELWIVEFKLRDRLTALDVVMLDQQTRRYAWAVGQQIGRPVAGVIVDERLNAAPKKPRILKSGRPSHAKDQMCTADSYLVACQHFEEPINGDTFTSLQARNWQQRIERSFTPEEMLHVGRDLVSAARLVGQLDAGTLEPVRNAGQARCPSCAYREICDTPDNEELVDALFERVPPKRSREPLPKAAVGDKRDRTEEVRRAA